MIVNTAVPAHVALDPFHADPEALYTTEEAAHLLNVAERTLSKWDRNQTGPVAVRKADTKGHAGRFKRYTRRSLLSWIKAHEDHGSVAAALLAAEARITALEAELVAARAGRNCNAP